MIKDNGSHEKPPLFRQHLFSSFVERFIARGDVILLATTSLLPNASLQAGMAQMRVNDVDKHTFHRQLGITGVAQATGMDMLLNAGCMLESRKECADMAGLQGVTLARAAHPTSRLFRFVDSQERNDSSAVHYTPFSCVSSTGMWFLLRVIEVREARSTSDRFFRRVAEISQGCSEGWTQHGLPLTGGKCPTK
jgi:hypothetical protein